MASLSAALALERAGHEVVLLDRDLLLRKNTWEQALLDKRAGIAQFFQPHAFWLAIPASDPALKVFQHERAFMAACRTIPAIAGMVDPAFAEPSSAIRPMGGRSNTRCQWV